MNQDYPGASCFTDRHGKRRWRFRRKGKTIVLPGQPGEPAFDAAYQAAITGQPSRKATVIAHPKAAEPRSLGAAWRLVERSAAFQQLDIASQRNNIRNAETFLESRIHPDQPYKWRAAPIADLRRRHLKEMLASYAATPHKAKHILVAIRKMITAALDAEWIEIDPSYKLQWRPAYKGWKAWPVESMRQFEAYWPIGSRPRLVFALAFWLGNRRSDIAALRWDQRCTRSMMIAGRQRQIDGFAFTQEKTRKAMFLPISPMLHEVLAAAYERRQAPTVLQTCHGQAHSPNSLTNLMAEWTAEAGLAPGHTLHGLRKTMGKWLAEGGASTRQLMEVLGHTDMDHAELYSREAEQALLAVEGMDKVIDLHRHRTG